MGDEVEGADISWQSVSDEEWLYKQPYGSDLMEKNPGVMRLGSAPDWVKEWNERAQDSKDETSMIHNYTYLLPKDRRYRQRLMDWGHQVVRAIHYDDRTDMIPRRFKQYELPYIFLDDMVYEAGATADDSWIRVDYTFKVKPPGTTDYVPVLVRYFLPLRDSFHGPFYVEPKTSGERFAERVGAIDPNVFYVNYPLINKTFDFHDLAYRCAEEIMHASVSINPVLKNGHVINRKGRFKTEFDYKKETWR